MVALGGSLGLFFTTDHTEGGLNPLGGWIYFHGWAGGGSDFLGWVVFLTTNHTNEHERGEGL